MSLYYNKNLRVSESAEERAALPRAQGAEALVEATRVRRHPERADYGRATINAILDEGLVAHVGLASEGQPFVLPVLYARVDERLYLHGSPKSRLLSAVAEGVAICLTVTLLDGLVLARSAFHHSLNYRSVLVLGHGRVASDGEEKQRALRALVDHVMPGRSELVRGPSQAELKVTEVVALELTHASAKVRTGPPIDNREDHRLPVWAGELPLRLAAGQPVVDSRCHAPEPAGLRSYRRGRSSPAPRGR